MSLRRGAGPIGVTATPMTLASSAPVPPPRGPIRDGHIRGYPIIIRGLVQVREWSSHRCIGHATWARTTLCQSMSNRMDPGHLILSRGLWISPGLKRLSSNRKGRVKLHRGKPVLEFPVSSPQILLIYSLTCCQDLTSFRDAHAVHPPLSKVSHPGGNVCYCSASCDSLAEQETYSVFFP